MKCEVVDGDNEGCQQEGTELVKNVPTATLDALIDGTPVEYRDFHLCPEHAAMVREALKDLA
jgi:hypothetical protein